MTGFGLSGDFVEYHFMLVLGNGFFFAPGGHEENHKMLDHVIGLGFSGTSVENHFILDHVTGVGSLSNDHDGFLGFDHEFSSD